MTTPRSPALLNFTDDEVRAIYAVGRSIDLAPGEVLFRRGEVGDSMYLIVEGVLDLHFVEGDPGKVLQRGDVLGELAFITGGNQRTATARAQTPCQLKKLDEEAVDALFARQPRLLLHLLRNTCRYLLDAEERLIDSLRQRNRELEQTLDYLRRTREEVDYQELLANTDPLTKLYNRRCFERQLDKAIARATKTGSGLALLLIDLDEFKQINDTFGHAVGDDVLVHLANILQAGVRTSDLPCRFGGDEFAIILPEINEEIARQRARSIRQQVAEATLSNHPELSFTVSVGGTLMHPGESATELFERADQTLYRAKEEGRDRVAWG